MSTENAQKIKLLKMMELLRRETDEEHPIPRLEMMRRLEEQGIPSSERSITRDIDTLNEYGFEVGCSQLGHQRGYYIQKREFSVAEIRLLMDAVQAAGFISEEKTQELIGKIANLNGCFKGNQLKTNTVHFNIRKHSNESVFEYIEILEEILRKRRKASFCYFDLNEKHERVYRHEHVRYLVEPLAMVYDNGYYYLLCYNTDEAKFGDTVTYRIDRMDDVQKEEETISAEARERRKKIGGYTSRVFRMFGGPEKKVVLEFDDGLIGAVYDRFGEQIRIKRINENTCTVKVTVQISPTFKSWVYQFGEKMKITIINDEA